MAWLILLLLAAKSSSHRILLLPNLYPSLIHQHLILGQEMVARGHQVYCLFSSLTPNKHRASDLGIKVITFNQPENTLIVESNEYNALLTDLIFSTEDAFAPMFDLKRTVHDCEDRMADADAIAKLRRINFDLAIVDGTIAPPCYMLLPEYLGLPFVSIGSVYQPWWTGVPALPSFTPAISPGRTDRMAFMDRLNNAIDLIYQHSPELLGFPQTNLLTEYTPEVGGWSELYSRARLNIVLVDFHLDVPLPSMPNTIQLPGITLRPEGTLTEPFNSILNKSESDIIVFSFGSSSAFLPQSVINIFLKAFSELEETVIWKNQNFSDELCKQVPTNVHIYSWIPQNDLLGHPKTKAFITHCGNNGQYEALYHGVPMLGIPLFFDQHYNCFRAEAKGFALSIDIHKIRAVELVDFIHEIINNQSFSTKIHKYSRMLKSRPMLPREEAAYWIEHILEFGDEHLKSAGNAMSWYKYFMLDVVAFVIIVASFVFFGIALATLKALNVV